jgi:hypothetical protein
MNRTWKGTTAGILTLIGGIIGIAAGGLALAGTAFLGGLLGMGWLAGIGGGLLALGILALIGGITTLKRKSWGFSLAGAIFALFPVIPLGVLAIVFVSLAKSEFE